MKSTVLATGRGRPASSPAVAELAQATTSNPVKKQRLCKSDALRCSRAMFNHHVHEDKTSILRVLFRQWEREGGMDASRVAQHGSTDFADLDLPLPLIQVHFG